MNVVGYCRFSSEGQRDGYSIEAQERAIRDFCLNKKYNIVKFYVDEAKTGTNDNREQFQQMINDAKLKQFKAIIVHKFDRFSRDKYDSVFYKKIIRDSNVELISILEPLDDSPESVILESLYEGMADYYSKNLSREVLKGKKEVALKCQHNGGKAPYGYDVKDKKYVINEREANVVKIIFAKAALGLSHLAITKYINGVGYRNRDNKPFNSVYITRILTNEMYKGTYIYGLKSRRKNINTIKIDDAVPPIVSKEQFDSIYKKYEVNRMHLAEKHRKTKARNQGIDYLLTGYLYCGICGGPITGFHSHKKYIRQSDNKEIIYSSYWYRCGNKATRENKKRCILKNMHQDQLENYIFNAIENIIFNDTNLKTITNLIKERLLQRLNKKDENDRYLQEIEKSKKQLAKLLDLYLDGLIDKQEYAQKKYDFDNIIKINQEQIKQLPKFDINLINVDFVKSAINKFRESYMADTIEYKKMTLSTFIDSIIIDNDKITIYFKFPVGTDAGLNKQEFSYGHHFLHNDTTHSNVVALSTNILLKIDIPIYAYTNNNFNDYSINLMQ